MLQTFRSTFRMFIVGTLLVIALGLVTFPQQSVHSYGSHGIIAADLSLTKVDNPDPVQVETR